MYPVIGALIVLIITGAAFGTLFAASSSIRRGRTGLPVLVQLLAVLNVAAIATLLALHPGGLFGAAVAACAALLSVGIPLLAAAAEVRNAPELGRPVTPRYVLIGVAALILLYGVLGGPGWLEAAGISLTAFALFALFEAALLAIPVTKALRTHLSPAAA